LPDNRNGSRPFHQRVQYSRRIARELDWLMDNCRYPEPAELYASPPSREGE